MSFNGFPAAAFEFYEGLAADNSKTYWKAHRPTYEVDVKGSMVALLDDLADFGPFHIFRPYNDVRFAKGRPPYKDHVAAYGESQGGAGYYVQFSHHALLAGAGYYQMASDQLQRFRRAVDTDAVGAEIADECRRLGAAGLDLGAIATLKTAPRGYPKDHPHIDLLRRKGLVATKQWTPAAWMRTKAVTGRIIDAWHQTTAMNAWLDSHVGPSTLAPDEDAIGRFGPL